MPRKPDQQTLTSEAGKELAKLGSAKGGRARASTLTAEERSEIARNAVRARWEKAGKLKPTEPEPALPAPRPPTTNGTPFSLFRGTLDIGNVTFECHVLNDGRRVLTQNEVVRVVTGGSKTGNLKLYLRRHPLLDEDFFEGRTIQFKIQGGQNATGYEATLLIELCESYLDARLQGLLKSGQGGLARQAEIVVRACAKVGIIALIDEATGYQKVREKQALQLKLQAFIADEMQDWAKMFPDEFWYELARLEGIRYSPRNRPLRWGQYVMMFVYDAIDQDVGRQLREINPNPHHRQNHHQWLKQYGRDKVNNQIQQVVAVMKLCDSIEQFKKKFAHVFKKTPLQTDFGDIDWTL